MDVDDALNGPAKRLSTRDLPWILGLVAMTAAIWCNVYDRWSQEAWSSPLRYSGDEWNIMAFIKAFSNSEIYPAAWKSVESLNAPFGANWNDYPLTEEMIYFGTGLLAKAVGLFAAANLAVLLAHLLAAVSFYITSRLLRHRSIFCLVGAVVFSFSHYIFYRGLPHLNLTYYWHIPLCLLVTWWGASSDGLTPGFRYRLALAVAIATGLQSPYYTNIFIQFLLFSMLTQLTKKKWAAACTLAKVTITSLAAFFLMNADTLSYNWVHGSNPDALNRSIRHLELYSMRPLNLFMPQFHRWEAWSAFSKDHYYSQTVTSEASFSYIGIIGIIGLIWLACRSIFLLSRGEAQKIPVHGWQILWIMAYSVIGGANYVVAILGIPLFRATNRFSVVILALALLFLVGQLSRIRSARLSLFIAAILLPVALWDQLPRSPTHGSKRAKHLFSSDMILIHAIEQELPNDAMIFQLPAMVFPESRIDGMMPKTARGRGTRKPIVFNGKQQLRPYLHSKELRFTYGSNKGRETELWHRDVAKLSPLGLLKELERIGFAGILIHRWGYPDGADEIIEELSRLDRGRVLESAAGDFAFIFLEPRHVPDPIVAIFSQGWYRWESSQMRLWRWSSEDAEIVFYNMGRKPVVRHLDFNLTTLRPRSVSLHMRDRVLLKQSIAGGRRNPVRDVELRLKPGRNSLKLVTDQPPGGTVRPLTFGVYDFEIRE